MGRITSNRYAILVVGVITMLLYGIIYAWSVFIPPLEDEFGWSRSQTSLVFSISMIGLSVGMFAVGLLSRRFSLRTTFLLGATFVVCGMGACRFISAPWHLYLLYGVCCGTGVGLAYTSWTTNVLAWFGDKVGFASGFLVMGFGMGGVVLGEVAALLIYSALGWRWAFTIIGLIVLIWSLFALQFVRTPPPHIAALHPAHDDTGLNLSGSQTVRQPAFWIFSMWRCFTMGSCAALIAQASVVMLDIGSTIAFSTLTVGLLSLGNGIGRPIGGIVFDAVGERRTLVALPSLGLAVTMAMIPCYLAHLIVPFAVLLLAEGTIYGMYSTLNTSFMRTTFGQRYMATNTGLAALVLAPFNLVFPLIAAGIYDTTGSYDLYLIFAPLCMVISLICGFACKPAVARLTRLHAGDSEMTED